MVREYEAQKLESLMGLNLIIVASDLVNFVTLIRLLANLTWQSTEIHY